MGKFNCEPKEEVQVGHLIVTISRMLASRADRLMERIGLFRGQAKLLMILSDQDGLTHSEMAEKLEISPAAATKVIKRLEALNYLQRQADPSDERISRLYLKDEGWAVIHQIKGFFAENERVLLNGLSGDEKEILIGLLLKVYDNLQAQPVDAQ